MDPISPASICPLCHTVHVVAAGALLVALTGWQCRTCGQRWDAKRLATVAAYALRRRSALRPPGTAERVH